MSGLSIAPKTQSESKLIIRKVQIVIFRSYSVQLATCMVVLVESQHHNID